MERKRIDYIDWLRIICALGYTIGGLRVEENDREKNVIDTMTNRGGMDRIMAACLYNKNYSTVC